MLQLIFMHGWLKKERLLTGRNISFIYVWMLSQPCLNTQFQLLSAAIQLPSEIAKKFIHVWILFTQLNLTIQLSYAWHRLFMQLILRRVNCFSACCAISCNLSVTPLPPIMLWSHKDVYNLERGRRGGSSSEFPSIYSSISAFPSTFCPISEFQKLKKQNVFFDKLLFVCYWT